MYVNPQLAFVLFNGPSGSGKTQTAKGVAAPAGVPQQFRRDNHLIRMDHKSLASPLVGLHSIKVRTKGEGAANRQLWLIHDTITDLIPPLSADFTDTMELVYDIQAYPLKVSYKEDEMVRDRNFMTNIADACHNLVHNPFAKRLIREAEKETRAAAEEIEQTLTNNPAAYGFEKGYKFEEGEEVQFTNVVLVSDLRLMRELKGFLRTRHTVRTILLKMEETTQRSRLIERDGKNLTEDQKTHETQVFNFEEGKFDLVVNTDTIDLNEQIETVGNYIFEQLLGVDVNANTK